MLMSVVVLCSWDLVSMDVPTTFLQGERLQDVATSAGEQRVAVV